MLTTTNKSAGAAGTRLPSSDPTAPADVSGRSLIERLQNGDASAFDAMVRRYGGQMLAVARRLLRNEDDAREIVQDAFLHAFRALDEFRADAKLSTWLHRIAVNAALMKLRSRRRHPEEPIDDLLPRFDGDGHRVLEAERRSAGAEEALDAERRRAAVRRCIDRLPETHRSVLVLRDVEGLGTEEAARALGVTADAAKMRLHRARQALRTLLVREGVLALPSRAAAPGARQEPARVRRPGRLAACSVRI